MEINKTIDGFEVIIKDDETVRVHADYGLIMSTSPPRPPPEVVTYIYSELFLRKAL